VTADISFVLDPVLSSAGRGGWESVIGDDDIYWSHDGKMASRSFDCEDQDYSMGVVGTRN
jgi:hypothetical protein